MYVLDCTSYLLCSVAESYGDHESLRGNFIEYSIKKMGLKKVYCMHIIVLLCDYFYEQTKIQTYL